MLHVSGLCDKHYKTGNGVQHSAIRYTQLGMAFFEVYAMALCTFMDVRKLDFSDEVWLIIRTA